MSIQLYLDTSDLAAITAHASNPLVAGFTCNPSLCRKAGVDNYEAFCRKAALACGDRPLSLEVLSDDPSEMKREARLLHSLAPNVYVKIPITNSNGQSCLPTVKELRVSGVKVNVTAIMTEQQVTDTVLALSKIPALPAIISIFAGRIADTGVNPESIIRRAVFGASAFAYRALWASTREVFNIHQAQDYGAHIITVSPELLAKYEKFNGMALDALSLETVQQFVSDAKAAGFRL